MKIAVTIAGCIDVPDDWDDSLQHSALDVADYRYNDQLTVEDALNELMEKMTKYSDDVNIIVAMPKKTEADHG